MLNLALAILSAAGVLFSPVVVASGRAHLLRPGTCHHSPPAYEWESVSSSIEVTETLRGLSMSARLDIKGPDWLLVTVEQRDGVYLDLWQVGIGGRYLADGYEVHRWYARWEDMAADPEPAARIAMDLVARGVR